jgi:hypothetical protein
VWLVVAVDDGTRNMTARANVLYGGGHKNYDGQNKNASGNLFLYPELSDQLASFDRFQGCMASDGTPTNGETFEDNTCVVHDGSFFFNFNNSLKPPTPAQAHCTPDILNKTVAFLSNNKYFSPTGDDFTVNCNGNHMHLADFQRQGYEVGSTIQKTPPVAQLIAMAKARLLPVPASPGNTTVHLEGTRSSRVVPAKTDDDAHDHPVQTLVLGGNMTVLLGSVYAPCSPAAEPRKWQNLNGRSNRQQPPASTFTGR